MENSHKKLKVGGNDSDFSCKGGWSQRYDHVLGGKFTDSGKCGEERSCGVIMGYLNHI